MQQALFLSDTPRLGISCLCHINFIWTSRWAIFDVLYIDLRVYLCACVYYLHLIQLTDLSMSEGTDTMKIRVSDQWAAMLYFPLDKFTKVFTSHLHTVVTARQEGSSQTHDNDRQLTLTIMPPLLTLKRARPLSFH